MASLLGFWAVPSLNGGPRLGIVPRRCCGCGCRIPATAFIIGHDRFFFTRQRRFKHCRFCSLASSVVGMQRPHFVAPPLRFRKRRLDSSRKRSCIVRCPTTVGADGPEAAYHFLAPRRPAAQQHVGPFDCSSSFRPCSPPTHSVIPAPACTLRGALHV